MKITIYVLKLSVGKLISAINYSDSFRRASFLVNYFSDQRMDRSEDVFHNLITLHCLIAEIRKQKDAFHFPEQS